MYVLQVVVGHATKLAQQILADPALQVLLLYSCFTPALLLLYSCFTPALLLLYSCFTPDTRGPGTPERNSKRALGRGQGAPHTAGLGSA
jgi:hypothetical protein